MQHNDRFGAAGGRGIQGAVRQDQAPGHQFFEAYSNILICLQLWGAATCEVFFGDHA
nr:hypothetical protein SHINE37_30202 [Rhizobiaceae bacterium]